MHISFLSLLCDPISKSEFKLEVIKKEDDVIIEGNLISEKNVYKIINGIPRFIKNSNLKQSFGFQWKKWNNLQFESQNIGNAMEGVTKNLFEKSTKFEDQINKNKIFLDVGAGTGRFADLLLKNNNKVICLDVSSSVDQIQNNFKNKNEQLLIVQCDFEKLPFKDESIDNAFSIGVLHHSKKPDLVFPEAYRVLKKEGSFAVSVYSKNSPYNFINIYVWRKFFNFLKIPFSFYPILIYTYFFVNIYYLIAKILKFKYLNIFQLSIFPCFIYRDKNWSFLDTFDSLSPEFASTHSNQEVYNWFADNKFKEISKIGPYDSNFKGFK
tara:strand:- start:4069 stop:5040 length:972 start_codon:yes stop_codon:yes gene_type:complete